MANEVRLKAADANQRPGRFDRLIYIPAPDEGSRIQILKIYVKNMPLGINIDLAS
jgi:transitional endoplasmic reticulum ATPase